MYVTEGDGKNSHYILMVNSDGSLNLNWYDNSSKTVEDEPIMVKRSNGSMMLEYGEKNLFGIRRAIPFLDNKGNLESRWERIK